MDNQKSMVFLASEVSISEQDKQLDPVFLHAHFRLADNAGNLKHEGMTAAFINDLVNRQDQFDCLPMYVDMERLLSGDFDNLTHLYSKATKKFQTTQFGSLTNFYSETDGDGIISLYAEARFPKRELSACKRLVEQFEMDKLSVSVELRYDPAHTIRKDGVLFVDAYEGNALTGVAIVSTPAYRSAVALDMVAEAADDSQSIVTNGEEPANRGETDLKEEEKELTAEVTEETVVAEENAPADEEAVVTVAEGEGASDSGSGASESDSGSGASDSGSGASDSGAGGSDSGEDDGDDDDDDEDPALTVDPSEEQKRINSENANAEVIEHSVDVHEGVYECPDTGETVHVVETRERVVETLEEQERVIAELKTRIAELEEIKVKYDAIVAEREAKELENKQNRARAFAEKQGLDLNDVAVAEAVKALDYTKIAELTMAQVQDEEEPEQKEEPVQRIALANFVELDIGDDNKYGGLLKPRNK